METADLLRSDVYLQHYHHKSGLNVSLIAMAFLQHMKVSPSVFYFVWHSRDEKGWFHCLLECQPWILLQMVTIASQNVENPTKRGFLDDAGHVQSRQSIMGMGKLAHAQAGSMSVLTSISTPQSNALGAPQGSFLPMNSRITALFSLATLQVKTASLQPNFIKWLQLSG